MSLKAVTDWAAREVPGLGRAIETSGGGWLKGVGKLGKGIIWLYLTMMAANSGQSLLKGGVRKLLEEPESEVAKRNANREAKLKPVMDEYLQEEQERTDEEKRLKQKAEAMSDVAGYQATYDKATAGDTAATADFDTLGRRSIGAGRPGLGAVEDLAAALQSGGRINPTLLSGISI